MTDRPVSAQQMKAYLAVLGVETEIDFLNEKLWVTRVDVKYPEVAARVLVDHSKCAHGACSCPPLKPDTTTTVECADCGYVLCARCGFGTGPFAEAHPNGA